MSWKEARPSLTSENPELGFPSLANQANFSGRAAEGSIAPTSPATRRLQCRITRLLVLHPKLCGGGPPPNPLPPTQFSCFLFLPPPFLWFLSSSSLGISFPFPSLLRIPLPEASSLSPPSPPHHSAEQTQILRERKRGGMELQK